jgi:hypothetical protein
MKLVVNAPISESASGNSELIASLTPASLTALLGGEKADRLESGCVRKMGAKNPNRIMMWKEADKARLNEFCLRKNF